MANLRRRLNEAMSKVEGCMPAGVTLLDYSRGFTLTKGGDFVRLAGWELDSTNGEWRASVTSFSDTVDGGLKQVPIVGGSPEEVILSAATGFVMGVFNV